MGIINKITTKIGELLSGEPAKRPITNESSVTEEKKPLPNSVETRGKIKKSTLTLLNSLYLANPEICKTKHLIVWLDTDKTTFNSYIDLGHKNN